MLRIGVQGCEVWSDGKVTLKNGRMRRKRRNGFRCLRPLSHFDTREEMEEGNVSGILKIHVGHARDIPCCWMSSREAERLGHTSRGSAIVHFAFCILVVDLMMSLKRADSIVRYADFLKWKDRILPAADVNCSVYRLGDERKRLKLRRPSSSSYVR